MRFPKTEPEVRALVQNIISGLRDNPNFLDPLISPEPPADGGGCKDAAIYALDKEG